MNCLPRAEEEPALRETMWSVPTTEQDGHFGSASVLFLKSCVKRKPLLGSDSERGSSSLLLS